MKSRVLPAACAIVAFHSLSLAQGPAFQSPGQSPYLTMGQTTRFSTDFNPAIGFVIDSYADWLDTDDGDDGFDAQVRILEFNAAAFVDPKLWAYVVITSEELESPEVEEAAGEYIGFSGNSTAKGGRFFLDFGKQMQIHLEELRTLERPLVLREYLGEELAGTGAQYDNWFAVGDATPVRLSVGVFAEVERGHEEDGSSDLETVTPERKDIDELSFSARLTGMTDVGDTGLFQLGASAFVVPEFSAESESAGLEVDDLSNVVYGFDATFGHTDDTGLKVLTAGAEVLVYDGDIFAELDDPTTPTQILVNDDTAFGYYVFGDYAWNQWSSAGVQFSMADTVEDTDEDAYELDAYYTRHFTEFRRMRLGVTYGDSDADDDFLRVYLQFTLFFGSHAHGLNW